MTDRRIEPSQPAGDDDAVAVDIRFVMVPHWILFSELISDRALRLYAVLRKHADNTTGHARPKRETLAKLCRTSVKSIDRALKELVAAGAVIVRARWANARGTSFRSAPDGEHVVRAPSLYIVRSVPPAGGGDTPVSTPPADTEGGRDTGDGTGPVTGDAGVGTPVTQELDPVDLDPEELERGCVSGVTHLPPAQPVDNPPPPPHCPDHPEGSSAPCWRCRDARLEREAFDAEQARQAVEERHAVKAADNQAAARAAVDACGLCDRRGFREDGTTCMHYDPARERETARRGMERVRAVLAEAAARKRDRQAALLGVAA